MRFDIAKERDRIRAALVRLRETQGPGECTSSMGGKTAVIDAVETEIVALIREGYTPRQVATAMRDGDRFSILPKSITQALGARDPARKLSVRNLQRKPKRKPNDDANAARNAPSNGRVPKPISGAKSTSKTDAPADKRGSFAVHNDTKDDDL